MRRVNKPAEYTENDNLDREAIERYMKMPDEERRALIAKLEALEIHNRAFWHQHVKIKSNGVTGVIVDIGYTEDFETLFTVESDKFGYEEDADYPYGYPHYECSADELEFDFEGKLHMILD